MNVLLVTWVILSLFLTILAIYLGNTIGAALWALNFGLYTPLLFKI